MKCCYACFFFARNRSCLIANHVAEREQFAETDPLLEFWCSRFEKEETPPLSPDGGALK